MEDCKFTQAIKILENEGWVQEELRSAEGFCLMGALSTVYDVIEWTDSNGYIVERENIEDTRTRLNAQGYDSARVKLSNIILEQFRDRMGIEQPIYAPEADECYDAPIGWNIHLYSDSRIEEMEDWDVISTFNDCPLTTVDDVKLVLEKAAVMSDPFS